MRFKALFCTLVLIFLTILKVLITIVLTTVKTILVRNDWLWTQAWNTVVSFAQGLLSKMTETVTLGLWNMIFTLLSDITSFLYGILWVSAALLTKMVSLTFWIIKYLASRWKDLPSVFRQRNTTEETAINVDDLS